MKVFLTGGTGFIGRSLAKTLLARDWSVIAAVRRPDGPQARSLSTMGVQCVPGDVTDRESMRSEMAGADIVIHNAGHYEYGVDADGRRRMKDINVRGTDNVLGLARELRAPRAVYVSTRPMCDKRPAALGTNKPKPMPTRSRDTIKSADYR
jgi:dihydroflavonol-4-reductase